MRVVRLIFLLIGIAMCLSFILLCFDKLVLNSPIDQAGCHLEWVETHSPADEWDYNCVLGDEIFERAWVYHIYGGGWQVDYRRGWRVLGSHMYATLEQGKAAIEKAFR